MSLADWANVNELNEFATAINAIDAIKGSKPIATASSIAPIAPIAPIAVAESRKLEPKERAYLLNWLKIIGETDQEEIEYTLKQCESDAVVREWFLSRARKLALFENK